MPDFAATGPNAEQIEYWNEVSGPKWASLSSVIDAQISPLGRLAMDRARIAQGERVLDVGCGCGETSVELSGRVGPEGAVLGVDLSAPMLDVARARAEQGTLANLHFEQADAQTVQFDRIAGATRGAGFDVFFSRFGVMFFADPVAAFTNLFGALAKGGRFTFVAWQALQKNPWMLTPIAAAAKHLDVPPPGDPFAPGPFAFADAERVESILTEAGFSDVVCESVEQDLQLAGGQTLDETVGFLLNLGPAGALLRDATAAVRATVAEEIRTAIAPFEGPRGVEMPAAAWIFSGRRPG